MDVSQRNHLLCIWLLMLMKGQWMADSFPISNSPAPFNVAEDVYVTQMYNVSVCVIDGIPYEDGEFIPTIDPCESCICHPPGFACKMIRCKNVPSGCIQKAKRLDDCCPRVVCDESLGHNLVYRIGTENDTIVWSTEEPVVEETTASPTEEPKSPTFNEQTLNKTEDQSTTQNPSTELDDQEPSTTQSLSSETPTNSLSETSDVSKDKLITSHITEPTTMVVNYSLKLIVDNATIPTSTLRSDDVEDSSVLSTLINDDNSPSTKGEAVESDTETAGVIASSTSLSIEIQVTKKEENYTETLIASDYSGSSEENDTSETATPRQESSTFRVSEATTSQNSDTASSTTPESFLGSQASENLEKIEGLSTSEGSFKSSSLLPPTTEKAEGLSTSEEPLLSNSPDTEEKIKGSTTDELNLSSSQQTSEKNDASTSTEAAATITTSTDEIENDKGNSSIVSNHTEENQQDDIQTSSEISPPAARSVDEEEEVTSNIPTTRDDQEKNPERPVINDQPTESTLVSSINDENVNKHQTEEPSSPPGPIIFLNDNDIVTNERGMRPRDIDNDPTHEVASTQSIISTLSEQGNGEKSVNNVSVPEITTTEKIIDFSTESSSLEKVNIQPVEEEKTVQVGQSTLPDSTISESQSATETVSKILEEVAGREVNETSTESATPSQTSSASERNSESTEISGQPVESSSENDKCPFSLGKSLEVTKLEDTSSASEESTTEIFQESTTSSINLQSSSQEATSTQSVEQENADKVLNESLKQPEVAKALSESNDSKDSESDPGKNSVDISSSVNAEEVSTTLSTLLTSESEVKSSNAEATTVFQTESTDKTETTLIDLSTFKSTDTSNDQTTLNTPKQREAGDENLNTTERKEDVAEQNSGTSIDTTSESSNSAHENPTTEEVINGSVESSDHSPAPVMKIEIIPSEGKVASSAASTASSENKMEVSIIELMTTQKTISTSEKVTTTELDSTQLTESTSSEPLIINLEEIAKQKSESRQPKDDSETEQTTQSTLSPAAVAALDLLDKFLFPGLPAGNDSITAFNETTTEETETPQDMKMKLPAAINSSSESGLPSGKPVSDTTFQNSSLEENLSQTESNSPKNDLPNTTQTVTSSPWSVVMETIFSSVEPSSYDLNKQE